MSDAPKPLSSALAALTPSLRQPPAPDGRVTQADRQQLAGTYAGVLAAGAAIEPPPRKLPRSFVVTVPHAMKMRVDVDKDGGVRAFEVK